MMRSGCVRNATPKLIRENARLRRKLREHGCELIDDVDAHLEALASTANPIGETSDVSRT
jgi:hypothetical protein